MPYSSISEIQAANKALGHYWFDEPCRAETPILGGYYWVESRPVNERDHDLADFPSGRSYAPVVASDDGRVDWLDSNAIRLATLGEARALIDAVLEQ
jgi:hypothetical protein